MARIATISFSCAALLCATAAAGASNGGVTPAAEKPAPSPAGPESARDHGGVEQATRSSTHAGAGGRA